MAITKIRLSCNMRKLVGRALRSSGYDNDYPKPHLSQPSTPTTYGNESAFSNRLLTLGYEIRVK